MFKDQNPQFLRLGLLGTATTKMLAGKNTPQCIQSASSYCKGGEKKAVVSALLAFPLSAKQKTNL